MYNPSRGGVRGGADQFTWESVKTDKHRENYLGHSLMAPVGRWQKGKDLSWYAKERKDDKTQEMIDRSEMASIKKAEEEAMLIALGHNIVKKTQTLTKEDMREALKRNTEREDHQIERIDGVGATSQRIASLSGVGKDARLNNEGVAFETVKERNIIETNDSDKGGESMPGERKKNKKKLKKHKKEKKHKKHHKESRESDASDDSSKYKTRYDKNESDDDNRKSSKIKHLKKSKHSHKDYASDSDSPDSADERSSNLKDHKIFKPRGGDYVDSDSLDKEKGKSLKGRNHKKCKNRHKDYSSDSDSPDNADERRSSNLKDHKIFKPRGGDYVDSDSLDKEKGKSLKVRNHKKCKNRHKDYSSDSDSPDNADERRSSNLKDHKIFKPRGGDYVDSDSLDKEKGKSLKVRNHKKCKNRHKDYSSDSDSPDNADERRSSNLKDHKIFKPRGGDYVDSDSLDKEKGKSLKVRNHKKCKNRHKDYSSDSDSPDNADERRSSNLKDHKIFKPRGGDYVDSDSLDKEKGKSLKGRNHKKCKNRHKDYSSDSDSPDSADERSSNLKDHKIFKPRGGDYVDSDSLDKEKGKSLKGRNHKKCKNRHKDYSSDSDSPASVVQHKTKHKKSKLDGDVKKSSKEKSHKKSKHKHKDYSSEISDEISHPDSQKRDNKRHKIQKESVKRCRHDTSESN